MKPIQRGTFETINSSEIIRFDDKTQRPVGLKPDVAEHVHETHIKGRILATFQGLMREVNALNDKVDVLVGL